MSWITFDTSAWILNLLDSHWLLIGFVWGVFKIYAKRSSNKVDDEIVELMQELKAKKNNG